MSVVYVFAMHDERKYVTNNEQACVQDGKDYYLKTGIGKVNAASALTKFLEHHDVDAIINIGFAGSVTHHQVMDMIVIDEAYFHDVDATLFGYLKYQVPGMPKSYKSDPGLLNKTIQLDNIKMSTLYTGDQFITESMPFEGVVDMEGAAFYQVAYLYNKPIISIKLISDVIGQHSYQAFDLDKGSQAIAKMVLKLKEVL
jgi:adenosylhomocysteine nucleosidase